MIKDIKLLRSMLYVPTYKKKFIDNAVYSNADALLLDLEDSIPFGFKDIARKNIEEYINNRVFKNKNVFIRLNPIESKLLFEDLKYVLNEDINGFMLTKIYTHEDIIYYDKLITQLEFENNIELNHFKFVPLIETTSSVMDVYNIAKASSRIIAVAFGGEDFLNDLEGKHGEPPKSFDYPRAAIALAARAANVYPIDTPYLSVKDFDGFIKEESISFELGFAGCQCLHPEQIKYAHICFTPTPEEIEKSKQIKAAIEKSKENGSGVAMLDGKMIGPPMLKRAQKVLEMVEQIKEKNV